VVRVDRSWGLHSALLLPLGGEDTTLLTIGVVAARDGMSTLEIW